MTEYADTSFLVSLYVGDCHQPQALAHAANWGVASPRLPLTPFGRYELQNTLRRTQRPVEAARALEIIARHRAIGLLEDYPLHAYHWLETAETISKVHAWTMKARALDALHIASALLARRKVFLTFDQNQRHLATLCGLSAPVF